MDRHHPHLLELNAWPWLESLSRRESRTVTLGGVPDREWDTIAALGIDLVYLMGVWSRSDIGRQLARGDLRLFSAYDRALPGWRVADVIGSAFCIKAYEPDSRLGTREELVRVRQALHERGMKLILDFIPNHTGFDHPWLARFPERYVCGTEADLRADPAAFRAVEVGSGEVRVVACGRDPFFPPWTDVAQLNYCNSELRAAARDELVSLAGIADGVRCDMAMLVLSDVFGRTWGRLAGAPPSEEFWAEARKAVPGLLLIAEVYWDLEFRLQELGFDFTYDKRLYDRLHHGQAEPIRAHLEADEGFQRRSARFIENHDEARSATAFGDRIQAAAVTMSTIPGLRFFHQGQFDGRRLKLPVQLGRMADEPRDGALGAFYNRLLAAIDHRVFHDGSWRLLSVQPAGDSTSGDLLAWEWVSGGERRVVVVNPGASTAQGRVVLESWPTARDRIVLEDLLDSRTYSWTRDALVDGGGLYVRVDRGGAHLFRVT